MLVLMLLACKPDPCDPTDAPELVLGTGFPDYVAADDGAEVMLVAGQQGGFHVDIALEGSGFDTADLVSGTFTGSIDGQALAGSQPWFQFACDEEAEVQRATGLRLIFFVPDPRELAGETLEVDATVTDASGNVATAQRSWVLATEDVPTGLPPDP